MDCYGRSSAGAAAEARFLLIDVHPLSSDELDDPDPGRRPCGDLVAPRESRAACAHCRERPRLLRRALPVTLLTVPRLPRIRGHHRDRRPDRRHGPRHGRCLSIFHPAPGERQRRGPRGRRQRRPGCVDRGRIEPGHRRAERRRRRRIHARTAPGRPDRQRRHGGRLPSGDGHERQPRQHLARRPGKLRTGCDRGRGRRPLRLDPERLPALRRRKRGHQRHQHALPLPARLLHRALGWRSARPGGAGARPGTRYRDDLRGPSDDLRGQRGRRDPLPRRSRRGQQRRRRSLVWDERRHHARRPARRPRAGPDR